MPKLQVFDEHIEINGRYKLYNDGVIYDTAEAQDIPYWIFEFRDFVLKNADKMQLE